MSEKYLEPGIWNKRTYPRYDYRAGISIKSNDPGTRDWDAGITQNLSQDGMSILHSKVLIPGETVLITLPLFPSKQTLILSGEVQWIGVDDLFDDGPYWVKAGIKFHDLDFAQREIILSALTDRKAENHIIFKKVAGRIDFVM